MDNHKKITFETLEIPIEGTPTTELPKQILDYYMDNGYGKMGIPLSSETVKEIARILNKGGGMDA